MKSGWAENLPWGVLSAIVRRWGLVGHCKTHFAFYLKCRNWNQGTKVEWKAISDFELEPRELKEHQSRDTAESKQVSELVWLGKVWV